MNPKRALQNLYFEYTEAHRAFQEAKRNHQTKIKEIMTIIFNIYSEWCKQRFGATQRPWHWKEEKIEAPIKTFYDELGIHDKKFRSFATRCLDSIFDEKEAS